MITKRIIPCLDVKNGRVVKGVNFEGLSDVSSPVELAKYYSEVSEEMYDTLLKEHSKQVCDFSYLDLEERENTMYSAMSYKTDSEYMQGYFPNYDNVNSALYSLYSLAPLRIVKLDPDADMMEEYGVLEPAHLITYYYDDTDEEGNTILFSIIDYFFYNGEEYAILTDSNDEDAAEADAEDEGIACYVMKIVATTDESGEELEEFVPVEDQALEAKLMEIASMKLNSDEEADDED